MKILQKIKEWKLKRPESQWSKKKLTIAGAALVVAVGLVIGPGSVWRRRSLHQ